MQVERTLSFHSSPSHCVPEEEESASKGSPDTRHRRYMKNALRRVRMIGWSELMAAEPVLRYLRDKINALLYPDSGTCVLKDELPQQLLRNEVTAIDALLAHETISHDTLAQAVNTIREQGSLTGFSINGERNPAEAKLDAPEPTV